MPNIKVIDNPRERISDASEIDIARFAAYLDGEGSITLQFGHAGNPGSGKDRMGICVSNTDARLMKWLIETFGGVVMAQRPNPGQHGKKILFSWRLHSVNASFMLERCKKYLIIKPEEARLAIAFQATFCKPGFVPGRKGVPRGLSILDRAERGAIYEEFRKVRDMRKGIDGFQDLEAATPETVQ